MSSEDEDMLDGSDAPDAPDSFNRPYMHATLPASSQTKYNLTYQVFQKWNKSNGWSDISEDLLMKYFMTLEAKNKPPTLFTIFSMLKATFRINDDIDIGTYSKLIKFLKDKNVGYKPVSTIAFTDDEIEKFVKEAPDDRWLDVKVVCIFGVIGLYNTRKLVNLMVEHVKRYEDLILVTTPKTSTSSQGTFTITGTFFNIVQKYADLRQENPNAATNRFFLQYHDGKCTGQPIGKNKFCSMPKRVATFLKLPESARYSALSFRRSSANSYANTNAWNQMTEPPSEQVDLDYQTGYLKTSPFSYKGPPVPAETVRHMNPNHITNGTHGVHVCTLSCGQVRCALEENEESVLHAFNTMKPPEYVITDLTPAVYPTDPFCRWIVAYSHSVDAVTATHADETFEDITRSIPNNVRINQRYIRGNTIHLPAAYVIVYGVNCKCQKETEDIFSFSVNEVKFEV